MPLRQCRYIRCISFTYAAFHFARTDLASKPENRGREYKQAGAFAGLLGCCLGQP